MRRPIATRIALAMTLALLGACAGASPAASPASSGSGPTGSAVSPPSETQRSAAPGPTGAPETVVATACYGLGDVDCRRVAGHIATMLTAGDPSVRYLQVGPFGCADADRCPTTLLARPEGDVTAESPDGAVSFHVRTVGGVITAERQEAFGIALAPSSSPPVPAAPLPLTLGHCGLWSGIDVGGSWWDPVGPVDLDHPDAINAAPGTFAAADRDHAVFTSRAGLVVQLVRRDGEKFLPLCD
jgi:hypothetical protein